MFMVSTFSVEKRNNSFPTYGILILKLVNVPPVARTCARDQVGTRVEEKPNPGPRPAHYSPAQPLNHLSKVIRTAYQLEPASSRYHITSPVLFLQSYQSPIRCDIYPHSGYENRRTNDKPPPEPLSFVVVLVVRNPPRLFRIHPDINQTKL